MDLKVCFCGGEDYTPHEIGTGKCYREVVPPELSPHRSLLDRGMWVMPGGYAITYYTLTCQRLYCYHPEIDRWSRPKDHESVNSIEA